MGQSVLGQSQEPRLRGQVKNGAVGSRAVGYSIVEAVSIDAIADLAKGLPGARDPFPVVGEGRGGGYDFSGLPLAPAAEEFRRVPLPFAASQ
jgi:hypothetical protein